MGMFMEMSKVRGSTQQWFSKFRSWSVLLGLSGLIGACAAAEPGPAKSPSTNAAGPSAKSKDAASSADGKALTRQDAKKSAAETASASKSEEAGSVPKEPTPDGNDPYAFTTRPHDVITGDNTSYAFNFTSSEANESAEKACKAKAGDDPQLMSECMSKARAKIGNLVLVFYKKNRTYWWITYERRGEQLLALHKIPFEFGPETKDSVVLRPTGKDEGLAPLGYVPREVMIRLPNEYSIELKDSTHGRMVYDAKIGMIQTVSLN